MDKIKNAAIIILGMGEKCAAEILKNMSPKDVQAIIEAINQIDNVSEQDVVKALNEFFNETTNSAVDITSIKNLLFSAVGSNQHTDGIDDDQAKWIESFKWQPQETIIAMIQDEHPQVVSVILSVILNGDKASKVIKGLPKNLQNQVIKKASGLSPISVFAMEALADFFKNKLDNTETYNAITVDGVEAVANIISYLDSETEREIMTDLTNTDKLLTEKIQEKILPFERLAHLDNKSLQTLLKDVKSEDLVLALKGVDEYIKSIFMKNMSQKAAEILQDDIEAKGPVKLAVVVEAQKKIIRLAKKLADEEKIVLSTKSDPDVVY